MMQEWTEKYRPTTLNEVVGNEQAIKTLTLWAKEWILRYPKKRAVIISGKPGIGKTSCVLALAQDFSWPLIEMNASDTRNALTIKRIATSGSLNETFNNDGMFLSSTKGRRKLILLDEADNLYEGRGGSGNNLTDKGGKTAILETISSTHQPIVLIVNNHYNLIKGERERFSKLCLHIRFYQPSTRAVTLLLKRICIAEGLSVEQHVLDAIAGRCKGDIRSALNDLQSISLNRHRVDTYSIKILGYRDYERNIFETLREIFKTKTINAIRESVSRLDMEPRDILLWIVENIPKEYRDFDDLVNGYKALTQADLFLGRLFRRQAYGLWSYSYDLMSCGVALAKTHEYTNDKYSFPQWLRDRKSGISHRDIRLTLTKKIAPFIHSSLEKTRECFLDQFISLCQNDFSFAKQMQNIFQFNDEELKYLLQFSSLQQVKDFLSSLSVTLPKETSIKSSKIGEGSGSKKERKQQTLSDFS